MYELKKLREEIEKIEEQIGDKNRLIEDLRMQIGKEDSEIWNLNNERIGKVKELEKLRNKDLAKYSLNIDYKRDEGKTIRVEHFDDLIKMITVFKKEFKDIRNIRIDINPERF